MAHVDDVTGADVLLLHLAGQVQAAHGHQVGLVVLQPHTVEEAVVEHTGSGHWHGVHGQLHPWRQEDPHQTTSSTQWEGGGQRSKGKLTRLKHCRYELIKHVSVGRLVWTSFLCGQVAPVEVELWDIHCQTY